MCRTGLFRRRPLIMNIKIRREKLKTKGNYNKKETYLCTKSNTLLYLISAYHRSTLFVFLAPPFPCCVGKTLGVR